MVKIGQKQQINQPVFQVPTFSFDSFQQILIIRDDKLLANNNARRSVCDRPRIPYSGLQSSSTGNKHKYYSTVGRWITWHLLNRKQHQAGHWQMERNFLKIARGSLNEKKVSFHAPIFLNQQHKDERGGTGRINSSFFHFLFWIFWICRSVAFVFSGQLGPYNPCQGVDLVVIRLI